MRRWLIPLALLVMAIPLATASAQRDCGNGLPCGAIPWPRPNLPRLSSPTPMPTFILNTSPTPTLTVTPGGPTVTPIVPATPTPGAIDPTQLAEVQGRIATLNALVAATPQVVLNPSGTPVGVDQELNNIASGANLFFGYARTVSQTSIGKMSPILGFVIMALVVTIGYKTLTFILPLIVALWGMVRKIISLIPGIG